MASMSEWQGYRNRYNLIYDVGALKMKFYWFWKKVSDYTATTIVLHQSAIQILGKVYALSFYRSKNILDRPNRWLQIFLVGSKSFWSDTIHFSRVWIWFLWINFFNLDLFKMIWTRPKQIGPSKNDWYSTKMIWMVQSFWTHWRTRHSWIDW